VSHQDENYYADDWWLEFLEGELEPSLEQDMAQLVLNSEADRKTLQGLAATREWVKLADESLLPEDGRYYDQLHARIMKEIRAAESITEPIQQSGAAAEADVRERLREKWMSY
jgi:tRNA A22 N-methylase